MLTASCILAAPRRLPERGGRRGRADSAVLFGPEAEIRRIADTARLDIAKFRIVATDGPEESALKAAMAAALARLRR